MKLIQNTSMSYIMYVHTYARNSKQSLDVVSMTYVRTYVYTYARTQQHFRRASAFLGLQGEFSMCVVLAVCVRTA
jgi:hypothetical protein